MTTTTADKGEQECREAFEKWAITQEWIAPVKNHEPFSRECYPDGDYDITAVRAAWAAWNRRPTNEGQDGLTDESVKTAFIEAHGGDEAYYNSHGYEIRWTTRIVTRHLSSKQADHTEQHLKMVKADAVKMPETIYVAFADNGNIRFWTADEARAHAFMQDSGIYCAEFTANTAKYQKDQV